MKKQDIAMIILISAVSVSVSYGAVSAIPGLKLSKDPVKVKTIDKYTSTVEKPNPDVFNKDAINPTVDITIGGNQADGGDSVIDDEASIPTDVQD